MLVQSFGSSSTNNCASIATGLPPLLDLAFALLAFLVVAILVHVGFYFSFSTFATRVFLGNAHYHHLEVATPPWFFPSTMLHATSHVSWARVLFTGASVVLAVSLLRWTSSELLWPWLPVELATTTYVPTIVIVIVVVSLFTCMGHGLFQLLRL